MLVLRDGGRKTTVNQQPNMYEYLKELEYIYIYVYTQIDMRKQWKQWRL
jgi:hypothetical protein